MEETAQVIAEAQAVEGRALLRAIAAAAEAAEAVAASEAIQSAAAAEAVRVLMAAGLVEETAAHEAVTALATAGLIVAAADQATEEAVADDAAVVTAADEATAAALAEDSATITAADKATAEAIAEDAATINAADEVAAEATEEANVKIRAASITVAEAQVLRYLPKAAAILRHRRQARYLPIRGQGASGAVVQEAGRAQSGRCRRPSTGAPPSSQLGLRRRRRVKLIDRHDPHEGGHPTAARRGRAAPEPGPGPELRRRSEHRPPHRPTGRRRPGDLGARDRRRPRARSPWPWPRPARRSPPSSWTATCSRSSGPRSSPTGSTVVEGDALRLDWDSVLGDAGALGSWWPTCPTTWPPRWWPTCSTGCRRSSACW